MPNDIDTVLQWTKVMLAIAAACTTTFPLLYLFSPWYRSQLGRSLMLQSIAVAAALDISAVYQYWTFTTNLRTILIINVGILAFIAAASLYLTTMLFIYNFRTHQTHKEN